MVEFWFYKQKTAYELRISDWSSDVSSSDLHAAHLVGPDHQRAEVADELGKQGRNLARHHFAGRTVEGQRSEEHTSELQSLMRISYAVFCLKKKKELKNNENHAEKQKHNTIHNPDPHNNHIEDHKTYT